MFRDYEDESGSVESVLFSSTVEKLGLSSAKELRHRPLIAELRWDDAEGKYVVRSIVLLEGSVDEIIVEIASQQQLARVTEFIRRAPVGAAKIVLIAPFLHMALLFERVDWSEDFDVFLAHDGIINYDGITNIPNFSSNCFS
jgi:hypothetical protein